MKKLNIELNVRRMQAQNILTTSAGGGNVDFDNSSNIQLAPSRGAATSGVSVHAGI